jgi:hypothetical protein
MTDPWVVIVTWAGLGFIAGWIDCLMVQAIARAGRP